MTTVASEEAAMTRLETAARPFACCAALTQRNRVMADLAFILLTVAIFALFGLVVKAVERL